MTIQNIFRTIMAEKEVTLTVLASRLNIRIPTLWERLDDKKDLRMSKAVEVARSLDYKIVVVPVGTRVPSDSYTIE